MLLKKGCSDPMNIAVLGSNILRDPHTLDACRALDFHSLTGRNTGNVVFEDTVVSWFPTAERVPWFKFMSQPEAYGQTFDLLVFPLANQLGPHTDLRRLGEALLKADVPVIGIGLGAQDSYGRPSLQVNDGTRSWVEVMARLSPVSGQPNISSRGFNSARLLDDLGILNVPLGCPSGLLSRDLTLGESILSRSQLPLQARVAVAAGHASWQRLAHVERDLVSWLTQQGGSLDYILQSDDRLFRLADFARFGGEYEKLEETLQQVGEHMMPYASERSLLTWVERHSVAFGSIEDWRSHLRNFDLIAGSRIHGCLLAIQSGRAALSIAGDKRVAELAIQTGTPFISRSQWPQRSSPDRLMDLSLAQVGQLDAVRYRNADGFVSFFKNLGVSPPEHLLSLAELRDSSKECSLTFPGASSPSCQVEAGLDLRLNRELSGWYRCLNHPDYVLPCRVDVDGVWVDTISSSAYRPDITHEGNGTWSGFSLMRTVADFDVKKAEISLLNGDQIL